jgi:predicted TIM-barrel fold metal-dependent hydrolase
MWSAQEHVAVMDRVGIDAAVLSVSSPGVQFGDGVSASDAIALARHVNDVAAATITDHPGRFGALASLPIGNLDESLAEIERAVDGLGLDGVNMLTHVGGVYLGDASLEPLMAELHRRQAVVFIHPTSPACWECTSLGFPRPMIEFPFDTTRAVTNLLLSGTLARYPGIRWIVPHAGGTLPFLASRIAGVSALLGFDDPAAIVSQLRQLHYDLAGSANATVASALLALVDRSQVLYGSDWPFTPEPIVAGGLRWIVNNDQVTPTELTAAASRLFPRLTR